MANLPRGTTSGKDRCRYFSDNRVERSYHKKTIRFSLGSTTFGVEAYLFQKEHR